MQDHYWDHREARWVHHVSPVELPEQREPDGQPDAQPVPVEGTEA